MNVERQGLGQATGKIVLMEEYVVVYGESAIVFPLQVAEITAAFTLAKTIQIDCAYFTGLFEDVPQELVSIEEVVQQILYFLKEDTSKDTLILTSTIPAERGMGSSAATTVITVRSLFDYFDYAYTYQGLFELVSLSEKIVHGNPSGTNAAAASDADSLFSTRGFPPTHLPMSLSNAYLIVADTGIKSQTRGAVKDIAQLAQNDPTTIAETVKQLGSFIKEAK